MRRNLLITAIVLLFSTMIAFQSCKKADDTTYTVYYTSTIPVLASPATFTDSHGNIIARITGNTLDLKWSATNKSGETDKWTLFFGTDPKAFEDTIKNITTNSAQLPVQDGVTYYWKVETVDKNGIKTSSVKYGSDVPSFTVVNGTNPEMSMDMSWTTDASSKMGLNIAADKMVDLRLLIVDPVTKETIDSLTQDGSSYEGFDAFADLKDGEYLIATDLASTIDAGDVNKYVNISINLTFNQFGIIDAKKLEFANIMTNEYPCDAYRTYLAKVIKTGASYTLERNIDYLAPSLVSWKGDDGGYNSVVQTVAGCDLLISGLSSGWMPDFWGETVVDSAAVKYTIDSNGDILIPEQYLCTTTYKGVQYPYYIKGTGHLDETGTYPVMIINYTLIQDGTDIIAYCFSKGWWDASTITATLTTDPNGIQGKKKTFVKIPIIKPNRK